jgi:hypothetical protein
MAKEKLEGSGHNTAVLDRLRGPDARMSRKGGECAYRGCLGKDWRPRDSRHSIASVKYASPP